MVADIKELEILDASEVLTPKRVRISKFPIADGTAKLFGRDYGVRESTLRREPVRSEDLREFQGNSERSQPTD